MNNPKIDCGKLPIFGSFPIIQFLVVSMVKNWYIENQFLVVSKIYIPIFGIFAVKFWYSNINIYKYVKIKIYRKRKNMARTRAIFDTIQKLCYNKEKGEIK